MMSETLLLSFLIVSMAVFAAVSFLSWKVYSDNAFKREIIQRMEQKLDAILNSGKNYEDSHIITEDDEEDKPKENEW
jgi:hypothetical protein